MGFFDCEQQKKYSVNDGRNRINKGSDMVILQLFALRIPVPQEISVV